MKNFSNKTQSKGATKAEPTQPSVIPPQTKPNALMDQTRGKYLAELFAAKAKVYTGDVDLPPATIASMARELRKAKATILELTQLDEKPYAVIPHDLATRSHWFMRRFRNSGGWRDFQ
jgi:hypothetical protein